MAEAAEAHLIVFTPSGRRATLPTGQTILDAARNLGVDLDSVCGGRGICGRCQVVPVVGDFPKHGIVSQPDSLTAFTNVERTYRKRKGLVAERRLGCMARLQGDMVIDVPPESQLHRQVVRKRVEVENLTVDPVLRLHYVEVEPATLEDPAGDVQRTLAALGEQWDLDALEVDMRTVGEIQIAVGEGSGAVTLAIRAGSSIVAAWPGFRDGALGIAFDVGSTTIAGQLCDLASGKVLAVAGRMNPQIRFGEDLMSRVSHVMLNPGGAADLTETVRSALDELVGDLVADAGAGRTDVLEVTLVGNPIMHHLVYGFDVRPLGEAPFALATSDAIEVAADAIGLSVHAGAIVYSPPCIAGHVGADATAVILSEAPHRASGIQLVVDVGTNAEIVLGNKDRLLAASSPTGPAFEGAQISSGQRAAPGAIERVRIDRDTLEPRYRVIDSELWSDDEGFATSITDIGVSGICGSGIIEAIAELYLTGIITPDGRFDPAGVQRSPLVVPDGRTFAYRLTDTISVTQNDVRAIQLAKAALYAGVRLLMDHLEIDAVDQIRLAGAFGSHIDVFYAMVLGLIPDCDLERVTAAGNAAGAGAMITLLDASSRPEIAEVVRNVEKIETALEPRFQEHFVEAMAFPHTTAPFPHLAAVVDLPEAATKHSPARRRRRRSKEPI